MAELRRSANTPRSPALVLVDPRGAFTSLATNPLAGLVFAIMLGFALLPPLTFLARGDLAAVVQRELKRSGKADAIPAADREKAVEMGAKAMKVLLPVGAVMKRAMWIALLAGLSFALLRGSKPDLKIEPLLGAVALAMAPLALHDVFVAVTFLVKDPMAIDAQNPVLSNPAAWLGLETGHSTAAAALKGLDFFELWSCALVGIGANVVAGTRSPVPYALAFGGQALSIAMAVAGAAAAAG